MPTASESGTGSAGAPMGSVLKALRVLEAVAEQQPAGLSQLTRQLSLPKSTVQRCLATLAQAGWLRADPSGRWEVTGRAFSVGARGANAHNLRDLAMPTLTKLQEQTGETIHLMLPDGDQMVLIERLDSPHHLRPMHALGMRTPLHAAANGKAYLAALPEAQIRRYLAQHLAPVTEHTLTRPEQLRKELTRIRTRGYGVADEELNEGIIAIAATIGIPGRVPIASLSISAPKTRVTRSMIEPFGRLVQQAAAAITAQLFPADAVVSETGFNPASPST